MNVLEQKSPINMGILGQRRLIDKYLIIKKLARDQ